MMVKLNTPKINILSWNTGPLNTNATRLQISLTKSPLKVKLVQYNTQTIDVAIKVLDSLRLQALLANIFATK